MSCLKKVFFFQFLIVVLFSAESGETYIPSQQLRKSEDRLLEYVNRERADQGLHLLKYNHSLYRLAMEHNRKMAREGKLSHHFPEYPVLEERLAGSGLFFSNAGENIAFSNVYPADFIHKGFVKSPEHYQNIIDPDFREAGIAILETGSGFYITQEFGTLISDISSRKMESKVLDLIRESGRFPDTEITEKLHALYGKKLKILSESVLRDPSYLKKTGGEPGFDINALVFNKAEQVEDYINNCNKEGKYGSIAFAVSSGRTAKYRGGAFSIVFLLRAKMIFISKPHEEIEKDIVATLNYRFENRSGVRFSYSGKLSRKAAAAVLRYSRGDRSLLSEAKYNILAYQAGNPEIVPEEFDSFFLSNRKKKYIGIKIMRPEENGIPENYFLLAFVFEK